MSKSPLLALFTLVCIGAIVLPGCQDSKPEPSADRAVGEHDGGTNAAVPESAESPVTAKDAPASGEASAGGWVVHAPSEGHYTVQLPRPASLSDNETTIARKPVTMHTARVTGGSGDTANRFDVVYVDYPSYAGLGSEQTDMQLIDGFVEAAVKQEGGIIEGPATPLPNGVHGKSVKFRTGNRIGECHLMLIEGRLFHLTAIRTNESGYSEADVRRFLDSFEFKPQTDIAEWTAEDLDRKWMNLKQGEYVLVRGQIGSIETDLRTSRGVQLSVGPHLVVFGEQETRPFFLADPKDAEGLVIGQDVLIRSRAYPIGIGGNLRISTILNRGEVPPNSPPPFVLTTEDDVAKLTAAGSWLGQTKGLGFLQYALLLNIESPSALTEDGELPPQLFQFLQECRLFRGIRISGCPIKQGLIGQLAQLSQLEQLSFEAGESLDAEAINIQDLDFSPLGALKGLRAIRILSLPGLSDTHLGQIAGFQCLRNLALQFDSENSGDVIPSKAGITALSKIPSLYSLQLDEAPNESTLDISDDWLQGFAQHPRLASLTLNCYGLDGSVFGTLSTCPRLQELTIGCETLNDESTAKFAAAKWPGLKGLWLSSPEIFDEGAKAVIEALPAGIRHLSLPWSDVSGATIDVIVGRQFTDLNQLSLAAGNLTNTDALKLSAVKSLTSVTLPPSVTSVAVEELTKSLAPGAVVVTESQ